ncbi:MAG: hypothetical protein IME99_01365 [Proteobacteria bacterium]|nr:hypothetical protein [Pseudomonadota bacterium]
MNKKRRRFDPAYRSPMTMAYARRMVGAVLLLGAISLFHQMYGHLHGYSKPLGAISGLTVLGAALLTVLPWRAYQLKGQRAGLYWIIFLSFSWWFLAIGMYDGLWNQILLRAANAVGLVSVSSSTPATGDILFTLTGVAQFFFAMPVGVYTWMLVREESSTRAPSESFRFMELS